MVPVHAVAAIVAAVSCVGKGTEGESGGEVVGIRYGGPKRPC